MDKDKLKDQQSKAEEFYKIDRERAMRIAIGAEKAPKGILPSAIYSKVCDEAEKSNDLEMCMSLANSSKNIKISYDAQRLKFRNLDSAIEKMKEVVNARIKAFEKTLPKGKTYEMFIEEETKKASKQIDEEIRKSLDEISTEEIEDFIDSISEKE